MQISVTNDQELIYSMIWVKYDRLETVIDFGGHRNKKSCRRDFSAILWFNTSGRIDRYPMNRTAFTAFGLGLALRKHDQVDWKCFFRLECDGLCHPLFAVVFVGKSAFLTRLEYILALRVHLSTKSCDSLANLGRFLASSKIGRHTQTRYNSLTHCQLLAFICSTIGSLSTNLPTERTNLLRKIIWSVEGKARDFRDFYNNMSP